MINKRRGLHRSTNGEACIMTKKLSVDKALEKLRGSVEPKSRMTVLDKKIRRLTKSYSA
jgi:hypothetical protein